MKYLPEEVEYPGTKLLDGCKLGTFYAYVPSTFLSGIMPWTKPQFAAILERYRPLPESRRAEIRAMTSEEIDQKGIRVALDDDVILLCTREQERTTRRTHDGPGTVEEYCHECGNFSKIPRSTDPIQPTPQEWWFFWLDCDVSDCCIGRFRTTDKPEEVIEECRKWLSERTEGHESQKGQERDIPGTDASWEGLSDWMELSVSLFSHGLWGGW